LMQLGNMMPDPLSPELLRKMHTLIGLRRFSGRFHASGTRRHQNYNFQESTPHAVNTSVGSNVSFVSKVVVVVLQPTEKDSGESVFHTAAKRIAYIFPALRRRNNCGGGWWWWLSRPQ
jgi:hypothetical protein